MQKFLNKIGKINYVMKCTLMRIELKEIQKMPSVFYVAFEFKAV